MRWTENKKTLYTLIILYTGGVLVRPLPGVVPILLLSVLFCCTACLYWIFSLNRRIIDRRQNAFLVATASMILLLHGLQILKYFFTGGSDLAARYLWYAYYIPMTLAPLFSVLAAIRIGRPEKESLDRHSIILAVIGAVLIVGVLTNDLHRSMFSFPEGILRWEVYERGVLYYVQAVYAYGLLLISCGIAIRKCTVTWSRKHAHIPLICVLSGLALLLVFYGSTSGGRKIFGYEIFTFQMIWNAMFVFFLETCIQVGLIPSNNGYEQIFEHASIRAQIADTGGNVVYVSKDAADPDRELVKEGESFTALLKGTEKHFCMRIPGGYIFWQEDIGKQLAINNELYEAGEKLREENAILMQENDLKAEQMRIETSNRLYDGITNRVHAQILAVEELLRSAGNASDDDFAAMITKCAMLLAYIKRTANLELISELTDRIKAGDLNLAIRESMEYAFLSGLACDVLLVGDGIVNASSVCCAYDLFEEIRETGWGLMDAFMVWIDVKDSFLIRMEIARKKGTGEKAWQGFIAHIRDHALKHGDYQAFSLNEGEDDELFLKVAFAGTGERKGGSV